jgi:hypothetical protein
MQIATGITINQSGTGYAVNDNLSLPGGTTAVVTTVQQGSGSITGISISNQVPLTNTPTNPVSPLPSATTFGTGATFTITYSSFPTGTPACAQSPMLTTVQMSTANTNRDGTGTLSALVAAGPSGSLIDWIGFKATVTIANGTVRIFHVDSSGNKYLIDEVVTSSTTPSGTAASANYTWYPPSGTSLGLPSGDSLAFCTNNAETWNVTVSGANY